MMLVATVVFPVAAADVPSLQRRSEENKETEHTQQASTAEGKENATMMNSLSCPIAAPSSGASLHLGHLGVAT